MRIKKRIAL